MIGVRFDAIVFDFDGVLVESVDVKTRAFAELYRPFGERVVALVVAHHLAHGGISRFEKFRHYHRNFLRRELTPEEEARLGERFAELVDEAVVASPMVGGAGQFLQNYSASLPLFVASGTPEDELIRIVARRGMAGFFRGVFGSPAQKGAILQHILAAHGLSPQRTLMIGDAMTDYDGAQLAKVKFLGRVVAGESNPFPPATPVMKDLARLADFVRE
jgi:phosphoglycolate phosphatase-like HAD superfamily hydrolase